MRLIIAGSRDFDNYPLLKNTIDIFRVAYPDVLEIVSGTARGADRLGERYAREHNLPIISCPADWDTYGKSAGYKRNEQMARNSHYCVCFWDGQSRGTEHMIKLARRYNLPTKVVRYE